MKITCMFLFIIATTMITGCNNNTEITKLETPRSENCILPQNPYNDGGGHDAGFNWAMENGSICNGNSASFNEGCVEYYDQLNKYNNCIASNRR